ISGMRDTFHLLGKRDTGYTNFMLLLQGTVPFTSKYTTPVSPICKIRNKCHLFVSFITQLRRSERLEDNPNLRTKLQEVKPARRRAGKRSACQGEDTLEMARSLSERQVFLGLALSLLAAAGAATGAQLAATSAEHGLRGGGEAVAAVMAAAPQEYNSVFLFTDGTPVSDILESIGGVVGLSGVAVMEVLPEQSFNATMKRTVTLARQLRRSSRGVTVVVRSDDPDFLSAFAELADDGRLPVWENRVLVVTRLDRQQFLGLMKDLWILSMLNAMLLNMDDDTSDLRYGLYSHFPYGPGGAQTVRLATWTPEKGMEFLTHHPLFPEKFTNFHGAPIPVALWPFAPYWMEEEIVAPNGTTSRKISGRAFRILDAIANYLNFTIGERLPAFSLIDMMSHVSNRRSLISPMKLALLPHLATRYDYTFVIEEATLTFCMAKPELKPRWQNLYYPLGDRVWASILALLVLVPAVFFLLHKSRLEGNAKENFSPLLVTEQVLGTLLGQNFYLQLPTVSSTRILVASWLVVAFILGTAYRGNLTAFLTIPKYPPRVENLRDLLQTSSK
ncbi:uncharacterized protein LOC122256018, partial [Penaeus japonicus]|uniref:uncharacterized protein LOC122256018 n=1 Tax=Penaeus japonicus TaxID=27405 RepID=UPI001C7110DC